MGKPVIHWLLYRVVIILSLFMTLIGLMLLYGQNQTQDALIVVVNSPARFAMRDVLLVDINTGVQYTLWRQQNVYRIAISPDNEQVAMALFSMKPSCKSPSPSSASFFSS